MLLLTHAPDPLPLCFPLTPRAPVDEGVVWNEPRLLANRPSAAGGWSVFHPMLTELSDGALFVVWTWVKLFPQGAASRHLHGACRVDAGGKSDPANAGRRCTERPQKPTLVRDQTASSHLPIQPSVF